MTTFKTFFYGLATSSILFLSACGHKTDVVESGSYQGKVDVVKPSEKEIYVVTDKDKRLELYFTDSTKLHQNNKPAEFSALKKDQKVRVKVEKVGKRLNPLKVEIMK